MPGIKPAPTLGLDRVVVGDCIAAMNALPESCADVVFADPPYNLQLRRDLQRPEGGMVAGVSEEWDLFDGFESYDAFTRAWLKAARRILKPDGTNLGHRQLSQCLSGWRCTPGCWLLGAQRYHLAQVQSDAQLPGYAVHQCP